MRRTSVLDCRNNTQPHAAHTNNKHSRPRWEIKRFLCSRLQCTVTGVYTNGLCIFTPCIVFCNVLLTCCCWRAVVVVFQRRCWKHTKPTGGPRTGRCWRSWSSTTPWCPTWFCPSSPEWPTPKEGSTPTQRYTRPLRLRTKSLCFAFESRGNTWVRCFKCTILSHSNTFCKYLSFYLLFSPGNNLY